MNLKETSVLLKDKRVAIGVAIGIGVVGLTKLAVKTAVEFKKKRAIEKATDEVKTYIVQEDGSYVEVQDDTI